MFAMHIKKSIQGVKNEVAGLLIGDVHLFIPISDLCLEIFTG